MQVKHLGKMKHKLIKSSKLHFYSSAKLVTHFWKIVEKYPYANTSALNNIRRGMLPELMNNPKYLLCKNSARIDPTIEVDDKEMKVIAKFLKNKKEGLLDDPGNSVSVSVIYLQNFMLAKIMFTLTTI